MVVDDSGGLSGHLACAVGIEFDFPRQFDNGFGMVAVLEECVFEGLSAINEQSAIEAVLFLGDPVATTVPANKRNSRCRVARGRFGEFHVGIPCWWRASLFPILGFPLPLAVGRKGWDQQPGTGFTRASNICGSGYEFD
jgi:hypothetical protein